MKLAIMQPYLFPYIGYFQLLNAADKFVIYDDVTYIKQGWINRNSILLNGKPFLFTVPLENASSYRLIREIETNDASKWNLKILKTIEQAYKKAPFYSRISQLLEEVFSESRVNISKLACKSLRAVYDYLEIDTPLVETSVIYQNSHLHSQSRVLDICQQESASEYINPSGGTKLYSREEFAEKNVTLHFIQPEKIVYRQFGGEFVPWLSIIDVMMFNSPAEIKEMLNRYELV